MTTKVNNSEIPDHLIDHEYHTALEKEFANDPTPVPSHEEVRKILSKVPGSLAEQIIADREERFYRYSLQVFYICL